MTPTQLIEQATEGLHDFVTNLERYTASMHLIDSDELDVLRRASAILDRMAEQRTSRRRSLNTDWAFYQRHEDEGTIEVVGTDTSGRTVAKRWWEDKDNLSFLASYMASHREPAMEVAYMIEKPWKYDDLYEQAQLEYADDMAAEEARRRGE